MLNRSVSLSMSTSILKALPGKLDIKRHSPSILYVYTFLSVIKPVTWGEKQEGNYGPGSILEACCPDCTIKVILARIAYPFASWVILHALMSSVDLLFHAKIFQKYHKRIDVLLGLKELYCLNTYSYSCFNQLPNE